MKFSKSESGQSIAFSTTRSLNQSALHPVVREHGFLTLDEALLLLREVKERSLQLYQMSLLSLRHTYASWLVEKGVDGSSDCRNTSCSHD